MDTTREVNWNLFIGNLYKWKYKEFLPLFVSANEQPPPHKTQLLQWDLTCLNHNILSFLRRTTGVWYWFIVVDLLGYTLSQLMTYYLYFSLLTLSVFGSFLNSMHPQFSLQGGSISMDIKIYTSATLGKQGPLTSTFGPPQDFPDSSVGKDSACKAGYISSLPG